MKHQFLLLCTGIIFLSCNNTQQDDSGNTGHSSASESAPEYTLTISRANTLAQLPLKCLQTEYPNKPGQTLGSKEDLREPRELHPAFYGCFDWHSSVHGHWSLVQLLKTFPGMEDAARIKEMLAQNITEKNIEAEVKYFNGKHNQSYERTYGWAWLLKLSHELRSWDDSLGKVLADNLQPLSDRIITNYMEFLPKLRYPIRVGEHTNTAFGLVFAWDYAVAYGIDSLQAVIKDKVLEFYLADKNCPLDWEPGGYDFLSPCLEEIDIMRRILDKNEFRDWMRRFAPQMSRTDFSLQPGEVTDRTDGKLVHLDGLNFSRAWVLNGLANQYPEYNHLKLIADQHLAYSLPSLVDGNYEGEHWLASFAIYALAER